MLQQYWRLATSFVSDSTGDSVYSKHVPILRYHLVLLELKASVCADLVEVSICITSVTADFQVAFPLAEPAVLAAVHFSHVLERCLEPARLKPLRPS